MREKARFPRNEMCVHALYVYILAVCFDRTDVIDAQTYAIIVQKCNGIETISNVHYSVPNVCIKYSISSWPKLFHSNVHQRSINWENHELIFVSNHPMRSVNTKHFTHSHSSIYLRFTAKCSTVCTCYCSASITIRLFRVRIVIVFIRSSRTKAENTQFIISLKSKSDMTFLAYLNWFPPRLRSILMPSSVL